ncbi:MAG TPA: M10 family metallopeptidase C-terminal domain-containing protein [Allosphingosinicella sp.]
MVQLYARSGGESVVNTTTQNFQGIPTVTRLNSGGYVVVWSDSSQTGADISNYAVKAQIYDSNGLKAGGEFQVNLTSTSGAQMVESVAATPNGGFVAVYMSTNNLLKAQRFDSSGAPVGGELSINALNSNHVNMDASVTVLTNGVMVVTWSKMDYVSGPNYGQHIYAKAFNVATGAALSGEFRIDSSGETGTYQVTPSVTALASGGWIATWADSIGSETEIVGQVFAANGTKVGGEFLVNTTTAGNQLTPVVTALQGGGFAIAWTDGVFGYSGSGPVPPSSIKAQVFTDLGVKVGGEILVNNIDSGPQGVPAIDGLPGGGFVVTWNDQSFSTGDRDGRAVMARVFDSLGAAVGDQFIVNTLGEGNQEAPAVAALASGRFVVAWHGPGNSGDVSSQLFAPLAGGASDIALSTSVVRETSTGNYAVAALSDNGGVNSAKTYTLLADSTGGAFRIDGDKLVIANNALLDYETAPSASLTVRVTDVNGNSYQEVLAVAIADAAIEDRYSAGAEFVAAGSPGDQFGAAIGQLASGGYVMTWVDRGGDGGDGSAMAVKAQRFDSAGIKVGGEILVNTSATGDQLNPAAAGLKSGGFVVVWEDASGTGEAGSGVRGQRFDSSGAMVGEEFTVNSVTIADQGVPSVAALESGGFVVTWTDRSTTDLYPNGQYDIHGQMYDGAGAKVGGEFVVNTSLPADQRDSSVQALPTGGFIVAWIDTAFYNVAVQRYDSAGSKVGGELHVGSFINQFDSISIATLASGGFVVSWIAGFNDDVRAQVFDPNGVALGESFLVNTETFGPQRGTTVSALPWGGFVISWSDASLRGGDHLVTGIRAQMFDSAGARIGEEFVVNTGIEGGQAAPVSTVLASGGFVLGWTDSVFVQSVNSSAYLTTIEGRVFSLTDGNAGNDVLNGDDNANVLDGGDGNDVINGLGGADALTGGTGNDLLDGGSGADSMAGGSGNDSYYVDDSGDVVTENAGEGTDEIRTGLAAFSLAGLPDVENLTGTSTLGQSLTGNGASNIVKAGPGNDLVFLQSGGDDQALGDSGNDVFLFGGTLSGADRVDGGAGTDQIALQGDYAGAEALVLGSNLVSVENIAILPGNDLRFGDPGTNFYDYEIVVQNVAVATGVQLVVDANRLRPGEDLTFDGSAETDGSFFIYGGGGDDRLTGGAKNDVFIFGGQGQWGSGDVVIGGAGIDQLALRGNYSITFGAGQLVGVEQIGMVSAQDTRYGALGSSYSYDLTMVDGNVDGIQMTVDASPLRAGETLTFNGSAEDDGSFRVFGGRDNDTIVGSQNGDILAGNAGADTLTGGGGADVFRYLSTSDSTSGGMDKILDFASGSDKIDLSRIDADVHAAGDQAFHLVAGSAFTGAGASSAGELIVHGGFGLWRIEGDTDGDGNADFSIEVILAGGLPPASSDFLL